MGTAHNKVNLQNAGYWATKDFGGKTQRMALFIELLLRDSPRSFIQIESVAYSSCQQFPVCFPFFNTVLQCHCSYCQSANPRCLSLMFCMSVEVRLLIRVDLRPTELMHYSFTVWTCARLERVCARIIRRICIMFRSFTKHFHISHFTHTTTLWSK